MTSNSVAIIGNGLASAMCADQISRIPNVHIDVFSPDGSMGRGAAYSKKTPDSMILNYSIRDMRFRDDIGRSFLNHAKTHFKKDASLNDFVPRRVFGDYVEKSIKDDMEDPNKHLSIIDDKVVDVSECDNGIEVYTDSESRKYDFCILALGAGVEYETASDGVDSLSRKDLSDKNVLMLGAGLTAIDYINYIFNEKCDPPNKIVMTQRRQGFRLVRPSNEVSISLNVLTSDLVENSNSFSCDEVENLISLELKSHGVDYNWKTCNGLFESDAFNDELEATLRRLSSDPNNNDGHVEFSVYSIFKALASPIQKIFADKKMSPTEVFKFRNNIEKSIFTFLAPMPPKTAYMLANLLRDKKVEIVTENNRQQYKADITLDCRGANRILYPSDGGPPSGILKSMIGRSMLRLSESGGVDHDTSNNRISYAHSTDGRMYLVGTLQKGVIFDCSDSGVIYNEAKKISGDIKERL